MHCSIRRLFAVLILLSLTVSASLAHTIATQRPLPPIRLLQPANAEASIRLETDRIDAEVQGTQAITTIELHFVNPNSRVLEGQLEFPLLDGQSVIGLAMEVNGKLRDGVPVEKATGQQVFEDVICQRIDPALFEATQGNQYRLRVYPIPASGSKRVVLKIADTLPVREQQLIYRLPLSFAKQLPHFHLAMRVFAAANTPITSDSIKGVTFMRHGEIYEAQLNRERVDINGVFEVRIPAPEKASLSTQAFGEHTYFQVEIPAPKFAPLPRRLPQHVALYWDASGSGAQRDHLKEFALLDRYFHAMGNGEVELIRFRDRAETPQTFKIARSDWHALKTTLEKTDYDGATAFGATTLQVKLTSGFGTDKQHEQTITLRLKQQSELVTVGEFEVTGKP